MIEVLPIAGIKSLRAVNAYSALLLGIKMLPAYCAERYEDFLLRVEKMPAEDQEKIFRAGAEFVELDPKEVEALLAFTADANGVSFGQNNIKNLKPFEIIDRIVAVCMKISEIKIDMVTEYEKKK